MFLCVESVVLQSDRILTLLLASFLLERRFFFYLLLKLGSMRCLFVRFRQVKIFNISQILLTNYLRHFHTFIATFLFRLNTYSFNLILKRLLCVGILRVLEVKRRLLVIFFDFDCFGAKCLTSLNLILLERCVVSLVL